MPHLLFIRRSDQVRHHKGEISFPGGSREPRDRTLLQTALRETHEEIGIPSSEIQVLGRLDDAFTLSRYRVSPFAGALNEPHPLHANREVDEIILLPVVRLLDPERFSVDTRIHNGEEVSVYTYEVCRRVIWGATARILKQLLDLLVKDPALMQALEAE
jgi:8-oxo-dGTP pyrophosphatase MutT (NUDIX family)